MTNFIPTKLKNLNGCPKCGSNWIGGSISDSFKKMRDDGNPFYQGKTNEEIDQMVTESYSSPYVWKREIGIEVWGYDGISYYQCPDCKTTWNRWTRKEESVPERVWPYRDF